ncbi:MAG: hypothetical protein JMDDDDMK_01834 [Acidobacteria bacterium]|nr:hypothetical protein [Acidobacteriota bacterium]
MNAVLQEPIAPEIIQALITQATSSGLSVNEYLRVLLGLNGGIQPVDDESLDAFMADMELLAEGTEHLPPSTITYSREDIYFDHD